MYHETTVINKEYGILNPISFGHENCEKSHFFGPAVRLYWLVHYVVSGTGTFKIQDKTYTLHSGEMFIIPPFVETYYQADSKNPWSYIWVGFTTSGELPFKLEDTIYCPEALQIFQDMKKCSEMENGRSAFLSARLWDLFSLLLESKNAHIDYVEQALNCIHSEYMNGINVKDIADRINLDRSYFSTIFSDKMGVSPGKYLIDYRMNIAASLMVKQGKSVSVAAYSVGYTDIYNFSKMFKKHFGISPAGYIKQKKEL